MLNTVGLQININSPNIQATKSVNKSVAAIGDVVTYTVTIPNTGLLPANNVIFIDNLPTGTSFIPGTVTVDNVPQTNANPAAGISLGTINNSASRTVTFQATVVSLPNQIRFLTLLILHFNIHQLLEEQPLTVLLQATLPEHKLTSQILMEQNQLTNFLPILAKR